MNNENIPTRSQRDEIIEQDRDAELDDQHKKSYGMGYKDGWRDGRLDLNNPPVATPPPEPAIAAAREILKLDPSVYGEHPEAKKEVVAAAAIIQSVVDAELKQSRDTAQCWFERLLTLGCTFERDGVWHNTRAEEAVRHFAPLRAELERLREERDAAIKEINGVVEECGKHITLSNDFPWTEEVFCALSSLARDRDQIRNELKDCQEERDACLELMVTIEKLMTNDDGVDPEAWWVEFGPDEANLIRRLVSRIKVAPLPDYMKNTPRADVCEHGTPKGYYCSKCESELGP